MINAENDGQHQGTQAITAGAERKLSGKEHLLGECEDPSSDPM